MVGVADAPDTRMRSAKALERYTALERTASASSCADSFSSFAR